MPTLTTEPQALRESHQYGTISSFGQASLQRRNVYPAGKKFRRVFSLSWTIATQTEVDELIAVFDSVKGGGTLTWSPPGESAGSYILLDDSLSVAHGPGGTKSVEVTLEEV